VVPQTPFVTLQAMQLEPFVTGVVGREYPEAHEVQVRLLVALTALQPRPKLTQTAVVELL
jgi:hypothetical protein